MDIARTARLLLRTVTLDDAPFYLALVNDPQFIAHIGQRHIHSLAASRAALADGPIAMQAKFGHALYTVTLAADATAVGMCGLIKRGTLPDVDLGYAFLPQFRGQGYAFEAAAAMLAHARALGLPRLMAIASPGNLASIGLLRKLGMVFVETRSFEPGDPGTSIYTMDL
ncbi:MAG: GNAT family N-acetyltransferase [Massilia sp.]